MFDSSTDWNCRLCIIEDEVTIWGQVGQIVELQLEKEL